MKLDDFLRNNNVARYRSLLVTAEDEAEGKTITDRSIKNLPRVPKPVLRVSTALGPAGLPI